jgi:hypothetical protein
VEAHGVRVQHEHLIPMLNKWTNRDSELSYLTIPKELCGRGESCVSVLPVARPSTKSASTMH